MWTDDLCPTSCISFRNELVAHKISKDINIFQINLYCSFFQSGSLVKKQVLSRQHPKSNFKKIKELKKKKSTHIYFVH